MKECAKAMLLTLWVATCASTQAGVGVTIDNVVQHFPYDGKIDITYSVSGVSAPDDFALEFACVSDGATNALVTYVTAPTTANGTRTAIWNAAADGVTFASNRADFQAKVHNTKVVYDGEYMVIDLSGGQEASSYPVTYMEADSTADFNTAEYKDGKLVLKKVEACTFLMGSPEDEEGRNVTLYSYPVGGPETQHYVRLSRNYFLGVFPVTIGQFSNVVNFAKTPLNAGQTSGRMRPVESQSYNNLTAANGFFDVLNVKAQMNGQPLDGFDFPTESQWECACRGGTTTAYYFGATTNGYETYCGKFSGYYANVVGTMPVNPWGFYDLLGNQFEFCMDHIGAYPAGTLENPASDPVHGNGTGNVIRRSYSRNCEVKNPFAYRSAARQSISPATQNGMTGFRLCINQPDISGYESTYSVTNIFVDPLSTQTDINDATLTLVTNRVEYTGSAVTVPIVLTHESRTLVLGTDYTLACSDDVNVGLCAVTISGAGDFAGTRLTKFRIAYPWVGESQKAVAKIDLRDGVLQVIVPTMLFDLAYNNTAEWTHGGVASETVKAVISAAPLQTAESVPSEDDFTTVLTADGEGTSRWRPTTRFTMVRLQIVRDGVVDPECTLTRVFDASLTGFILIVQ